MGSVWKGKDRQAGLVSAGLCFVGTLAALAACNPGRPPSSTPNTDSTAAVMYEAEPTLVPTYQHPTEDPGGDLPEGPLPDPHIPVGEGRFGPALQKIAEGETYNRDVLMDVDTCAACHQEVVRQWKDSMHRNSSFNNPFFQPVADIFRKDSGAEPARFCTACHDPALLFEDVVLTGIEPTDKRAHAGITCATCHGIVEATVDGNGSFTLTTAPIPLPKPDDPESLRVHMARVGKPALRSDALCASCHSGFLSEATGHTEHIGAVNDFTDWRDSGFNVSEGSRIDSVLARRCVDCHMPFVQGERKQIRSHRFPGGHMTMAKQLGSKEQMAAIEAVMKSAIRLDILAVSDAPGRPALPAEELVVTPGGRVTFDVVVINEGTGHRFPAGAQDIRDAWIELTLSDARGEVLAVADEEGRHEEGVEHHPHRMQSVIVSNEGVAVPAHRVAHFRTVAIDNTIPTRGAGVSRYTWAVPADLQPDQLPLRVEARVRQRRMNFPFAHTPCEESKTPRGRAFARARTRFGGTHIDPCDEQPIVEMADTTLSFGPGAQNAPSPDAWWLRLYRRGLGLEAHLQERLHEAVQAFTDALAIAPDGRSRARAQLEMGRIKGRQGRTDEALALFQQAEHDLGQPHASIALARGEALSRVWRWPAAAAAYAQATELAPKDDRAWRGLAIAEGSAGRPRRALAAAQTGLRLEPRDPFLLLSQLLAYQRLVPDDPRTEQARAAYLKFKRDEQAHLVASSCSDKSPDCWLERVPIHDHTLRSANAAP